MYEKFNHLTYLKEDLTEEEYRFTAAKIVVNHFLNIINGSKKTISRAELLGRVNLVLISLGLQEISYGYIRTYY